MEPGERWVRVGAPDGGSALLPARAAAEDQRAAVGRAAGGRVAFFLQTDDIKARRAAMEAEGVRFCEPIREEACGRVCVFEDLYGDRWDLIEPAEA